MLKYFRAALTNRWNLLALLAGIGVAAISGSWTVTLPLVLAAEAAYLSLVGSHPKFQNYVDLQAHQQLRQIRSQRSDVVLKHILQTLPRPLIDRYSRLRTRCLELQRIAADLKHTASGEEQRPFESLQVAALDKLLWLYLRLLFTYNALQRFLERTSRDRIAQDIDRIERRMATLDPQDASAQAQKIRGTLSDNLATSQDRLRNYDRAQANYEFVELEIDRLENKIASLAEVAVNRQEPAFVSNQVDQVAHSMVQTEKAMNDLQVFAGLAELDDEVPVLLDTNRTSTR